MDLEEKIDAINSNLDNDEIKKEAILLKNKLHKKSLIYLITSSIILVLSFVSFIVLLILGLRSFNATILFSIIPFVLMVLSAFGILFGVTYRRLKNEINV